MRSSHGGGNAVDDPSERRGSRGLLRLLGRSLLVVSATLLTTPLAQAAGAYPVRSGTLVVSGETPAPGADVTIGGSGYAPGATVSIDVYSDPVHLTTVSANGSGAVSATVTIPTGLSAGTHTLRATGPAPDGATNVLSIAFTVAGSDTLPVTGQTAVMLVTIGSLVLMVGMALVLLSGRRKRDALPAGGTDPLGS